VSKNSIQTLDLFAGVGGSSYGAQLAGAQVVAAIDFWQLAKKTYLDNFEGVKYYGHKCENLSPKTVQNDVGSIDLLIASPECTSHTPAKGNGERSDYSRMTAFQVVRFARVLKPRWIIVENVLQMRLWERYDEWINKLIALGYKVSEQVLNAAHFGVPQSRKRMFVICDSQMDPPQIKPFSTTKLKSASQIVDTNGTYRYSNLITDNRAKATLERARRAMTALGDKKVFLLVYYGSDGSGGWQTLDVPLRTVTTLDRFAYVRPGADGKYEMRMLQVPELKKAMGFPEDYKLQHGVRRDKVKLLGNAVCPPVMKAIVETLTSNCDASSVSREDQ
jgi:DNA (cytosine-5)-methyltransferase 1